MWTESPYTYDKRAGNPFFPFFSVAPFKKTPSHTHRGNPNASGPKNDDNEQSPSEKERCNRFPFFSFSSNAGFSISPLRSQGALPSQDANVIHKAPHEVLVTAWSPLPQLGEFLTDRLRRDFDLELVFAFGGLELIKSQLCSFPRRHRRGRLYTYVWIRNLRQINLVRKMAIGNPIFLSVPSSPGTGIVDLDQHIIRPIEGTFNTDTDPKVEGQKRTKDFEIGNAGLDDSSFYYRYGCWRSCS